MTQAINFNAKNSRISVVLQYLHHSLNIHHTLTGRHAFPKIPLPGRTAPAGAQILDVRCVNVGSQQLCLLHGIFKQAKGIAGIKINSEACRADVFDESQQLVCREVNVVFDGQDDSLVRGNFRGFTQHASESCELWFVGLISKSQAAADDAHDPATQLARKKN